MKKLVPFFCLFGSLMGCRESEKFVGKAQEALDIARQSASAHADDIKRRYGPQLADKIDEALGRHGKPLVAESCAPAPTAEGVTDPGREADRLAQIFSTQTGYEIKFDARLNALDRLVGMGTLISMVADPAIERRHIKTLILVPGDDRRTDLKVVRGTETLSGGADVFVPALLEARFIRNFLARRHGA